MSRLQKAARSLASGYAAIASSAVYALASIPLALHYLSPEEYGLWSLVTQAASYLLLLDAGITASVGRFLIDHKDNVEGGDYGSVIKTGCLVFILQGACVALGGCLLAWGLPAFCEVPPRLVPIFRVLIAGQCVLLGVFFVARILMAVLQAHHRFDVMNYSQIVQLAVLFSVQWLTFHLGWGLYSLLAAAVIGQVAGTGYNLVSVIVLRLFPAKNWGKSSMKVFKPIFAYGRDLFLLIVGLQLLNASQVVIITRTQGLTAATVWSVATKSFQVAFQFVQRIFDFSGTVLGEMIVRQEFDRLRHRYQHILLLTASFAVFVTTSVAVCNGSFVTVLTHGRVGWGWWNDLLLGMALLLNCVTRCQIGLSGYAKQVRVMRWVYFLEGVSFALAAFVVAPRFGIPGIIVVGMLANLAWSGAYGFKWVAGYLGVSWREIAFGWLKPAFRYVLLMAPISAGVWWGTFGLPAPLRLFVDSGFMALVGLTLLWFVALTPDLRQDLKAAARRVLPGRAVSS